MANGHIGRWSYDATVTRQLRIQRIHAALDEGHAVAAIVEAEELLDELPDDPDGLFLLGEALLEDGDAETATLAYEHAATLDEPHPDAIVGLTAARFLSCNLSGALEAAREAVRSHPDAAEAHFYLSQALDRLHEDSGSEAADALATAHRLDPELYPLPLRLDDRRWQRAIDRAKAALSPRVRTFWEGVELVLLDRPPLEELRAHQPPLSPLIPALYVGQPPEDDPWSHRPERLRLFRENLAYAADEDALVDHIAASLTEEASAWLGSDTEAADAP